jgi:hypothetical protein
VDSDDWAIQWSMNVSWAALVGNYRSNGKLTQTRPVCHLSKFLYRWTAQRVAPLLSINSLMRPRTEADNAQTERREDSNIKQCINHGSLH